MASVSKREGYGWQVRWKEGDKFRSKAFELKRDADVYKRKVERDVENGVVSSVARRITVRDLCEEFIRAQEIRVKDRRISAGAMTNFRTAIKNDVLPILGSHVVADLNSAASQRLYSEMVRRGLKLRSVKSRMISWNSIVKYALRQSYLRNDFREEARDDLRGGRPEAVKRFTQFEVEALLAEAAEQRPLLKFRPQAYLRCCVYLAAFCGLRISEIRGLRNRDIDYEGRILRVEVSITKLNEIRGTKTSAGTRSVPAPGIVLDTLRAFQANFGASNEQDLVFTSIYGGPTGRENFTSALWIPLLKRAGLSGGEQGLRFHSLRHFYGSWLIDQNVPLPQVAALMGHASIATTLKVYAYKLGGGSREHGVVNAFAERLVKTDALPVIVVPKPRLNARSIAHELRNDT